MLSTCSVSFGASVLSRYWREPVGKRRVIGQNKMCAIVTLLAENTPVTPSNEPICE